MKNIIFICFAISLAFIAKWEVCTAFEPLTFTVTAVIALINVASYYHHLPTFESNQPGLLTRLENFRVNEEMSTIGEEIKKILSILPNQNRLDNSMALLQGHSKEIERIYKDTSRRLKAYYDKNPDFTKGDEELLLQVAKSNLKTEKDHPYSMIKQIHDKLVLGDPQSILTYMENLIQSSELATCSQENQLQSFQQSLQKFLTAITVAHVQVYLIIKMSADFLSHQDPKTFPTVTVNYIIEDLDESVLSTLRSFKKSISSASREVWRCDPREHKEGITFIDLKRTFQMQLIDQVDMPDDVTCNKTKLENVYTDFDCLSLKKDEYPSTVYDGTERKLERSRICKYTKFCRGLLRDCESVHTLLKLDTYDKVAVCYSHDWITRRFDRFDIYNITGNYLKSFGQKKRCGENNQQSLEHIDHNKCYIYACICDDERPQWRSDYFVRSQDSYRYIYNQPVRSNYTDNYVVTGVRLARHGPVIYPMIQQGILLEEGLINQSSVHWVDVSPDLLDDVKNAHKIEWLSRSVRLGIEDVEIPLDLGESYDNVENVITGIQLSPVTKELDQGLTVFYESRLFNFTTGNLLAVPNYSLEDSIFETFAQGRIRQSDTIDVKNMNVPKPTLKSNIIIRDVKHLNFSVSNFETDLGQTTIPFFDMQNVTTNPAMPMVAAGFYYKYKEGFGGYIGIELKTLDLSKYFVVPESGSLKDIDESTINKLKLKDGRLGTFFQ